MEAKYWQKGETLDYTPEAKVKNGEVVDLGTRIGIAGSDIEAGEPGHIHVTGVFELAKKASEEIPLGAGVFYDSAEDEITTAATRTEEDETVGNTPAGFAVYAAAASDAVVFVKISAPVPVAANCAKAASTAPTKAEFDAVIDALIAAGLMAAPAE